MALPFLVARWCKYLAMCENYRLRGKNAKYDLEIITFRSPGKFYSL